MAHVLWQQRCLEVTSRLQHVGVVDEMRRTYRHHGRQRDASRRIATFHHATLRVATFHHATLRVATFHHATLRVAAHRYATREPLGAVPAALARFSADSPPQAPAPLA